MTSMNHAAPASSRRQLPPGLGAGSVLVRYDGSTILGPEDASADIPFRDLAALSPEIAESIVQHHGLSIFGDPVVYAQIRLEDLKHLSPELMEDLAQEPETGGRTAFFKEDGREAWLFVDTDAREAWFDQALDELEGAGLPVENVIDDLRAMTNAEGAIVPPLFPYWIEAGLTDLDLDLGLDRVRDLRAAEVEDPYALPVPEPR